MRTPLFRSRRSLGLLALGLVMTAGCRSMSSAPRPFESSRTFAAAQADPEPHVLTVTFHPPTLPIRFGSPNALARSLAFASAGYALHEWFREATGRTLGYHMVGHAMIEVKTVGSDGQARYLLTASTAAEDGETAELMFRQQVGYSLADIGTRGRLAPLDEVARDIDEAAETNVRAVRVRFLVSPAAAARMLEFAAEFERRRGYERYNLTGYPLTLTGVGCTSLVASYLDVAGLLDPTWLARWRVRLRVPEELFGDPSRGVRVPPRKLLLGPRTRRWATACEPHRDIEFFDTTAMHEWASRLATAPADQLPLGASNRGPVELALAARLGMPVVTIDRRAVPTPTGPIFR